MKKRRTMLIVLAALLAAGVVPVAAWAALGHHGELNYSAQEGGLCASCHNTAEKAATRGWKGGVPAQTGGWYEQTISKLCYTCHQSNQPPAHDVTGTAFLSSNHFNRESAAPVRPGQSAYPDNAAMVGSGLPYVTTGTLACTSCHNVHSDVNRPFNLRTTIGGMCDACHPNRRVNNTSSANRAVAVTSGDPASISTHPVMMVVDGAGPALANIRTLTPGASPSDNLTRGQFTDNTWWLGGKLDTVTNATVSSTGNMDCQTCHAVHGEVNSSKVTILSGQEDYTSLAMAPNDNSVLNNFLCEACHYGGDRTGYVGSSLKSDHPMDGSVGRASFYPDGVNLPSTWISPAEYTLASKMYDNAANGHIQSPRCSSCHDMHGGAAGTPLLRPAITSAQTTGDGKAGTGEYCFSCHSSSGLIPTLHHSNKSTLGTSLIDCKDCHGSSTAAGIWSAHNGFGDFAVGIDKKGTGDTGADLTAPDDTRDITTTGNYGATYQLLCEKCHHSGPGFTPTDNSQGSFTPYATLPASHNAVLTNKGSHKVSGYTQTTAVYVEDHLAANEPYNSFFRGSAANAADPAGGTFTNNDNVIWGKTVSTNILSGYSNKNILSKYGNTGAANGTYFPQAGSYLICESCHNLLYNVGVPTAGDLTAGYKANLLLKKYLPASPGVANATAYTDGTNGTQAEDGFCRGCHASTTPPYGPTVTWLDAPTTAMASSYVHYPAAHTMPAFTYDVNPYGRTTNTILTDPIAPGTGVCTTVEVSTADASTRPLGTTGPFAYPADNRLNCESCHRPHNAATASATYIVLPGGMTTAGQHKTQPCTQCHDVNVMCTSK